LADEARTIRFIMSANMRRRDLSAGQKAMIGLEIAPHLEAAAKQRQIEGGKRGGRGRPQKGALKLGQPNKEKRAGRVDHQIAKATGTGHTSISRAKKVRSASPTLAAARVFASPQLWGQAIGSAATRIARGKPGRFHGHRFSAFHCRRLCGVGISEKIKSTNTRARGQFRFSARRLRDLGFTLSRVGRVSARIAAV
jgi:hypothetical protein